MRILMTLSVVGLMLLSGCHKKEKDVYLDKATGLMWQNQPYTRVDKTYYDNQGNGGKAWTWGGAKNYCAHLALDNHNDWRLPKENELRTLLTKTAYTNDNSYRFQIKKVFLDKMPTLDGAVPSSVFISSTPHLSFNIPDTAYFVDFGTGKVGTGSLYDNYYVRCVRSEK